MSAARKRHKTRYPGVMFRLQDESNPDSQRRYVVFFSDGLGRQRSETLPLGATLEDARLKKGDLTIRKAKGESLVKSRLRVGEMLDEWLESRRDSLIPETHEVYSWAIESHLKPAFGHRKVRELSAGEIATLCSRLKKDGMKTWTVKKILTPLSGAYRGAVREGIVSASPIQKLFPHERPKDDQREMRCLGREEIPRLLESASTDRWRTLFSLLIFTGLRIGEALELTWDCVNTDSLEVRKSKTKAGERQVMVIPALRATLSAHRLKQAPGVQFLFANASGRSCSRRQCLTALRAAEKRAGLPNYTLHELRHTFASILIAQGELPTFVAHQMGHKDPGVTMKTYAHLFEKQESVDRARERLQEAFGGMV